jgi:RNA recognition motif. (a.k.a. RRM, RBD, or RNP domain)
MPFRPVTVRGIEAPLESTARSPLLSLCSLGRLELLLGSSATPCLPPLFPSASTELQGMQEDRQLTRFIFLHQQEYFEKSIGPVKRVMLVYGPNGQSRGIANLIFAKPDSAAKAFRELDGVKVDNKPMKV